MEKSKSKLNFKEIVSSVVQLPWFSGLVPLVLLCLIVLIINPSFFMTDNVVDMLRTSSYTLMIAAPFTLLMITGGLDLSMGAMISFGGVVAAKVLVAGGGILPAILATVLVCFVFGMIKSFIIVNLQLPAFIITLGLQYMINGLILVWTEGVNVSGLPANFKVIGQGSIFKGTRLFNTIIIAAIVAVVFYFLLEKTKFGRAVCAVGGNIETARTAGLRTRFYIYTCHILVSIFAGLTGILYASRFSTALTTIGTGSELNVIAATVIGGTSMFGGSGTMIGTVIGCILFAAITNALIMMGVSVYWQNFVFGLILIISIIIDKYRRSATAGSVK